MLLPVVANAAKLGLPSTPGTRASFDGQVPGDLTYKDWFARQGEAFQRGVLGPTKFDLFQTGRAGVKDFAGVRGQRSVADVLALVRRREGR